MPPPHAHAHTGARAHAHARARAHGPGDGTCSLKELACWMRQLSCCKFFWFSESTFIASCSEGPRLAWHGVAWRGMAWHGVAWSDCRTAYFEQCTVSAPQPLRCALRRVALPLSAQPLCRRTAANAHCIALHCIGRTFGSASCCSVGATKNCTQPCRPQWHTNDLCSRTSAVASRASLGRTEGRNDAAHCRRRGVGAKHSSARHAATMELELNMTSMRVQPCRDCCMLLRGACLNATARDAANQLGLQPIVRT